MNGDEVSGVTIMKMDEGLDTGDMLTKVESSACSQMRPAAVSLTSSPQPEQNFWWRHFLKLEKGEVTPEKQPEDKHDRVCADDQKRRRKDRLDEECR